MPGTSTTPGTAPLPQHGPESGDRTAGPPPTGRASPQSPRNRPRGVQWAIALMFGGVWLIAALRAAELTRMAEHRGLGVGLTVALALLVPVGLWWWRSGSGTSSTVFAALCTTASIVGDNPSTLGLLFLALIALMLSLPVWTAILLVVLVLVLQVTLMTTLGTGPLTVVVQCLFTLIVMVAGFGMALLLREFDQLARRNAELLSEVRRSVSAEKELVIADERSRAARDLHDGLGHRLAALTMSLEFAERTRDRDPDRAFDEVGYANTQAKEALAAMRTWVRALDPIRVGDAQGVAAFEAIAESFRGTGLEVEVSSTGSERELSKPLALFSYRFVQEGLTNALKHGGADRVRIVLDQRTAFVLTLRDNGTVESGPVSPGFGLRSLRERAEDLGGGIEYAPTREGFTLTATIPSSANDRPTP